MCPELLAIFIITAVVELVLIGVFLYNLIRYRYLGNKYFYVFVSVLVLLMYSTYVNKSSDLSISMFGNIVFDTIAAAVGKVDTEKISWLFLPGEWNKWLVIFYFIASYTTFAFLSITVILNFAKLFLNAFIFYKRRIINGANVYYLFTDSRNETVIPLATKLLDETKGRKNSVKVFVSRASLKTQEGNEFRDMLVGLGIPVQAEKFSYRMARKIFNSRYSKLHLFNKQQSFIYLLFSNDETTTKVATDFKEAILKNRKFDEIKKYITLLNKTKDKDKLEKLKENFNEKEYDLLQKIQIFVTYQETDLDILHNFSGETLHIMNTLSKYDMIASRFVFDNPISQLVDLNNIKLKEDNKHLNVTLLGFGVVDRAIFERMTFSYQLYGDNINKVNYHVLDRDADSLIKPYVNEYTDRNNSVYLYSIDSAFDGEDLRHYETIDRYISSLQNNPNRFQNDGFEIFVISVINSNNDLNIALNLRRAILKYFNDRCEQVVIYVRVAERLIGEQFRDSNLSFTYENLSHIHEVKDFDKKTDVEKEAYFNSFKDEEERKAAEKRLIKDLKAPIILFGNDAIMSTYLAREHKYFMGFAENAWKSYQLEQAYNNYSETQLDRLWLKQNKQEVKNNTDYVLSLRTKLSLFGYKLNLNKQENQYLMVPGDDVSILTSGENEETFLERTKLKDETGDVAKVLKIADMEHNRWLQSNNQRFRYLFKDYTKEKDEDLFGVNKDTNEKEITRKYNDNTQHICMITNEGLRDFYKYVEKKNSEYKDVALKLVYTNDIVQLRTIIKNGTEQKNK